MTVPARDFGNLLVTDRAEAPLFFPEVQEPSFSLERANHVYIKSFLEVGFPSRVIWVGAFCGGVFVAPKPREL
jgi:hypothetical protein